MNHMGSNRGIILSNFQDFVRLQQSSEKTKDFTNAAVHPAVMGSRQESMSDKACRLPIYGLLALAYYA